MTSLPRKILVLMALAVAGATPYAQQVPAETRGQLLYTTHCIACHTAQMHWRDDRLAYDWDSLKFQVRRWQRKFCQAEDFPRISQSRSNGDGITMRPV